VMAIAEGDVRIDAERASSGSTHSPVTSNRQTVRRGLKDTIRQRNKSVRQRAGMWTQLSSRPRDEK
jgi:hypothetical protein